MKDFRGKELNIGDNVAVAIFTGTSSYHFAEGVIKEFVNRAGYGCARIDFINCIHYKHVFSSTKIAKLND